VRTVHYVIPNCLQCVHKNSYKSFLRLKYFLTVCRLSKILGRCLLSVMKDFLYKHMSII